MSYIRVQACNLGNQMFRYMLAVYLGNRLPGFEICGCNMPEWGLVDVIDRPDWQAPFRLPYGHKVDIDGALRGVAPGGGHDGLNIDAFAQRMEYFGHDLDRFRRIFHSDETGTPVGDDEIVVNVRTGDILAGIHPDYYPLPLDVYRHILNVTGLRPVFVGQVEAGNWYTDALRAAFPSGRFVGGQGALADFQTVRHARHKIIAISTFSWLAAWLSKDDAVIHYPVAGFLNPVQRGDVDLLPIDDPRYRLHLFPVHRYTASPEDQAAMTEGIWDIAFGF
ncbi:hypothetical protein ABI_11400 [Asticcacaulis biprosthecium C19]|uniref:Polysaccharide pyruvyl transferase domain-containing protein n=1 Tax=Asticcacaulis biprosthecium C19 TaxID=715226 RepID=F4QHG6_9CAUL|nr:hypothetical protein [Asticcacaulis biprosthecium]EGF92703.1 hypothetical protein ABI_11400 [Asticcacaulis biprosthecium C19]